MPPPLLRSKSVADLPDSAKKSVINDNTALNKSRVNLDNASAKPPTDVESQRVRNQAQIDIEAKGESIVNDEVKGTSGDPNVNTGDIIDSAKSGGQNVIESIITNDPEPMRKANTAESAIKNSDNYIKTKAMVERLSDDLSQKFGVDKNSPKVKEIQEKFKQAEQAAANNDPAQTKRYIDETNSLIDKYTDSMPKETVEKLKTTYGENFWKIALKIIMLGGAIGLFFLFGTMLSKNYSGCYKRILGKSSELIGTCGYDSSNKDNCSCGGNFGSAKKGDAAICSQGDNANYPPCKCGIGVNPVCSADISADGSITYIWRDVSIAEALGKTIGDTVSSGILNPAADTLSGFFDRLGLGSAFKYILIGIGVLIFVMFLVKFAFRMMDGGGRSSRSDFSFSFYSN